MFRLAGETVREKSGDGPPAVTVRARGAVWVRLPDVPVKVTVAMAAAADDAAVRVTFFATPGVRLKVDELAVTPAGSPLSDTDTIPVKPFTAVAVTDMD
jgi:hypothetical protein